MSEKRYQVFVSSTYRDLVEERQRVAQVLQSMDCIPAGMELFPAIDEEQFEFIKKVIDDCDYYILLLAGRYGTVAGDGISYTEKEFDYAVDRGLRVIVMLRDDIESLSEDKRETDAFAATKLEDFRARVAEGRLVKMWSTPGELDGAVAVSLQKTIKTYPAPGWVRATGSSPQELLAELNDLRKQKEALHTELSELRSEFHLDSTGLASGADPVSLSGWFKYGYNKARSKWSIDTTWDRIIYHLGPHLYQSCADSKVQRELAKAFVRVDLNKGAYDAKVSDDTYYSIRAQLESLGLVTVKPANTVGGSVNLFWQLTERGKRKLLSLRVIEVEAEESE